MNKNKKEKEQLAIVRSGSMSLSWLRVPAAVAFSVALMMSISFLMYRFTEDLLTTRLQDRLIAIASTAASQFDFEDVNRINSISGPESIDSDELAVIVEKLEQIRSANENIQYAYIMRRTDDPMVVEFVADADTLVPEEELDINENGILEEEEMVPWPGDPYEVEDYPVLRDEAFYKPSVDRDLQEDQWGLIMAAYALILNEKGDTVAIVGIDVLVEDFNQKTQETSLPFLLFVLFLTALVLLLIVMLGRVYNERVEAMREIDRQKDELLSIVSHQLATPVSSMKWYLEMMLDGDVGKLTKEQTEHVQSLQVSAANLADLVSMILDVSRIQLGRMKVDRSEVDLDAFFNEVITVIDAKAKERGVEFAKKMPKKLPVSMQDKRLLHMTLENLLSNAVKYSKEKGGKVVLDVQVKDNVLHYTVTDNGCGIPKDEQGKIFGKLFRASNVQKIDGNGFGLYAAKGAVEALGGNISFVSDTNKGTTFTVNIPLKSDKSKSS